ncbi:hypothetical protein V1511DRAFT_493585 [Dipodascopsis uninucleata]
MSTGSNHKAAPSTPSSARPGGTLKAAQVKTLRNGNGKQIAKKSYSTTGDGSLGPGSTISSRHGLPLFHSTPPSSAPQALSSQSTDAAGPGKSHITISYLPSTVTTRSPRLKQQEPQQTAHALSHLPNHHVQQQYNSIRTPLQTQTKGIIARMGSNSSPLTGTSNIPPAVRRKSSSSTTTSKGTSTSAGSTLSKFVYANGEEEVLSPRRPATASSVSTVSSISQPIFHVSPTPSAFTDSSADTQSEESPDGEESDRNSSDSASEGFEQLNATEADSGDTEEEVSARVNRKILDIEISNTSLRSLNRTLERELRGAYKELRSLKRWIVAKEGKEVLNESRLDISDDEEVDDQAESDSNEGKIDISNGRFASRHLQTVDSELEMNADCEPEELLNIIQSVNGSISKCLEMSDGLIKDAHNALRYRVDEDDSIVERYSEFLTNNESSFLVSDINGPFKNVM